LRTITRYAVPGWFDVESAEGPELSTVPRVGDVQRAGFDAMLAEASRYEFRVTRHGVSVRVPPAMRHGLRWLRFGQESSVLRHGAG
jgi:hypothetical protein